MNREIKFRVWHEGKFHKNVQVRFYNGISGWEYGYEVTKVSGTIYFPN